MPKPGSDYDTSDAEYDERTPDSEYEVADPDYEPGANPNYEEVAQVKLLTAPTPTRLVVATSNCF